MAKQLQLELSNDDRGFFRTVGFHQNEQGRRVPRKFRLGHDRQQAFLKLQTLLDAWDEIPGDRGSKVWTDAAIQAALDSVPINQQASRSEISTDARLPRATVVVPPRPPPVPLPPPNPCMSFGSALDEFVKFTEARNDVGAVHRDGLRSRVNSIHAHLNMTAVSDTDRRLLGSVPVNEIDAEKLARIRNMITSRPLTHHQRRNRKPISIDTVKNWLMTIGMALDWFEITPRIGWTPPHHRWREQFTLTKKQEYALQTPEERDADGRPKAAFTVDELVQIYKCCTKLGRRYLLMGLTLGWAQEGISSFRRPQFVQIKGEYYIDRRRGKTGVEGYWWVCPELAALIKEAMGWTTANKDDLAFLSEKDQPLVHGKTDSIRLTWERAIRLAPSAVRRLPFGRVKKCGAQIIENLASHETAQLFLAHRTQTVAAKNYVGADVNVGIGKSPYEKLHDAQREMWKQLKPLFEAASKRHSSTDVKAETTPTTTEVA